MEYESRGVPLNPACTPNDGRSEHTFRLWDLACDGNGIYVHYELPDGGVGYVEFNGGCKQMGTYKRDYIGEKQRIKYRICIDDWGPNTCSHRKRDTT